MSRYVRLWVVVLALLTGLTIAVQLSRDEQPASIAPETAPEPAPEATPLPTSSPGGDQRPRAAGPSAPSSVASAPVSDLPSSVDPSAAAAPVRCWSGDAATDLADCPPLQGEAALRYVFPRLDEDGRCEPVALEDRDVKDAVLRCPVEVDGTAATVTYSEFVDRQALEDYYASKYDGPSGRSGDLVLFGPSPVGARDRVQGTAVYAAGGRWSVSFRGDDEELTRRVLDTVEVRRWQALLDTVDPADLDLNDP